MNPTPAKIRITEIFHSIQGESTQAGRPCSFVRLTGCNLRCTWCDTAYAFEGGEEVGIEEIVRNLETHKTRLVLVTGGEPLLQDAVHDLMAALLERGFEVMIETGGSLDIGPIDPRVRVVMDLKCPDSGMESQNRYENLGRLKMEDELKFVIASYRDYRWARTLIEEKHLAEVATLLMSPAYGLIHPKDLAEWILKDDLPVRLQIQLHKEIWPAHARGV